MGSRPKPICNYFARTGTCRFGADCRYSHDRSSSESEDQPATQDYADIVGSSVREVLVSSIFASEGVDVIFASNIDEKGKEKIGASAWEVTLKYGRNESRSSGTSHLADIISSAIKTLREKDFRTPELIRILGEERGIRMLNDILRQNVSSSEHLTRVAIPLVYLVVMKQFRQSCLGTSLLSVYSTFVQHPAFFEKLVDQIELCLNMGTISVDAIRNVKPLAAIPTTFLQLMLPVITLLYEIVSRFTIARYDPTNSFENIARRLESCVNRWVKRGYELVAELRDPALYPEAYQGFGTLRGHSKLMGGIVSGSGKTRFRLKSCNAVLLMNKLNLKKGPPKEKKLPLTLQPRSVFRLLYRQVHVQMNTTTALSKNRVTIMISPTSKISPWCRQRKRF